MVIVGHWPSFGCWTAEYQDQQQPDSVSSCLKINQTLGSMDLNPVSNFTPKSLTVMHCQPRQRPQVLS
jgi:hypothetical protein